MLHTMPSSKLPSTELSAEDDWTKVKDPKEKKRIQNRVAQRTYRHRMKARLGELQARLDSHEGRRHSGPDVNTPAASNTSYATPTPETSDGSIPPLPNNIMANTFVPGLIGTNHMAIQDLREDSRSPMSAVDKMPLHIPLSMPPTNIYDQPLDDTDPSLFPQAAAGQLLNSPPQSQSSPQPNGLLSPPAQPGADQGAKVSQDFMLDCLRFQTQLLNRLNNLQPESAVPAPYSQADNVHAMLDQMSHSEQVNAIRAFTPAHTDSMDFAFDQSQEVWKGEQFRPKVATAPESLNFPASMNGEPNSAHTGPVHGAALPPPSLPSNATLDQRFEAVLHQAEAAGFESFDDLVTAYYSGTFSDASPLAHEQRLSRNRRLPKVVADVSKAADSWSHWERRGFHEEVLKTAETMVTAESAGSLAQIMSTLGPLIGSQDPVSNTPLSADTITTMKRAVQNELPNSWAVTMALASDDRGSWQWDRSNTVLATIILLKFSGRIPNDQLLSLLGACLP